jgi:hypothetical protein
MSLAAVVTSKTVLQTILDFLVPLILPSAIDRDAACNAALDLLSDHRPATREELRLAAEIIAFSLQALSALRDAAEPGIPISRAMRLRASACTLRRGEQAAQRKLDALQRANREEAPTQERVIAAALKNASAYFADAYTQAREMGDAQSAEPPAAAAERPTTKPQVQPTQTPAPVPGAPTVSAATPRSPAPHTPSPRPQAANPRTTPDRQAARSTPPHAAAVLPPLRDRIDAALQRMNEELADIGPGAPETEKFSTDFLTALKNGLRSDSTQAPAAPAA